MAAATALAHAMWDYPFTSLRALDRVGLQRHRAGNPIIEFQYGMNDQFGGAATDFLALASQLFAVCEKFGPLHALHLVHNKRARRVSCCIELDSQKEHRALANALGAKIFGDLVCLEIPVSSGCPGLGRGAAEAGSRPDMRSNSWRATQPDALGNRSA